MTAPRAMGGASPPPPSPVVHLTEEMMYKGHQIEAGSYAVGSAWSPRAVVSVRSDDGSWQRTPLYATSSAKFPTRHEADHRALIVAKTWVDEAVDRQRNAGT
ncbi:MAG: hypothetical protein ACREF4_12455 [Gammaproteobacteria bacterium]